MPRYRYKAKDAGGSLQQGLLEGPSAEAVAEQLMSAGSTPLEIQPAGETRPAPLTALARRLGLGRPGLEDMVLFSRQAYALAKAGVPISRGLRQLADTARNAMLGEAIAAIVEDLEAGRDLAGAMARHPRVFSPLFVSMVRVGEESGRLDEALYRMFQYLEHERVAVNQVKAAMRYPLLVVGAVLVAVFVLMSYVIPKFAEFYSGFHLQLPLPTRIIIAASGLFADYWWAMLIAAGLGAYAFTRYIATESGRLWWDRLKLRLPISGGIILRATLARFSRAFAMASRSGVPILQGLTVSARAVDNEYVARKLTAMREGIERGESLTRTAVAARIFTPLTLQMIAVGEETGQVDDMLQEVAEFYEGEVQYDVKRLGDLIQPVLTVAVGLLVLFLALGVFLPMWDLVQLAR